MSQNIRLGIQYRFQQGKMQVNFGKFMGYTRGEDGQAVIVPEEAEVVKRIFREYLEGASLVEICRGLETDGILTGAHKEKWRPETVHKMLRNEKYMGDALLQKTYTTDFLTKKKVVNNGIAPQYYVENSHEAIIPKDIFMRVQEEMGRRANLTSGEGKSRRLYSSKYAMSGIVFCGHCGDIYRRIKWNNRGCRSTVLSVTVRFRWMPNGSLSASGMEWISCASVNLSRNWRRWSLSARESCRRSR